MPTAEELAAQEAAAKAAAEAKAKADADAAAAASTGTDGGAGGTAASELPPGGGEAAAAGAEEADKVKKGIEKRFSELTSQTKEARREATEANRRLDQALEALERVTGQPAAVAARKVDLEDPQPTAPEFQDPAQYSQEMTGYVEKLTDWKARRIVKAELAEQAKQTAEKTTRETAERARQTYAKRRAEFAKTTQDYDAIVDNDNIAISGTVASAIIQDEMGPAIEYHLGSNPEDAARIYALSPLEQLVEFGLLKAKLTAAKVSANVSRAPPPITQPVRSGSALPKTTVEVGNTPGAMDEYAARRQQDIADQRKGARR